LDHLSARGADHVSSPIRRTLEHVLPVDDPPHLLTRFGIPDHQPLNSGHESSEDFGRGDQFATIAPRAYGQPGVTVVPLLHGDPGDREPSGWTPILELRTSGYKLWNDSVYARRLLQQIASELAHQLGEIGSPPLHNLQ